jgi:hypothetical protein
MTNSYMRQIKDKPKGCQRNKHVGYISELKAAVWYMSQGFDVFRNQSAHGKYDLIIHNPLTGELTPIDITTGNYYLKKDGGISITHAPKKKDVNVLVVMPDDTFIWKAANDDG